MRGLSKHRNLLIFFLVLIAQRVIGQSHQEINQVLQTNNIFDKHCYNEDDGFINSRRKTAVLDHWGRLLVGTSGLGLMIFDGYGVKYYNSQSNREYGVSDYIQKLEKNNDGDIYLGANGVGTSIIKSDSIIHTYSKQESEVGFANKRAFGYFDIENYLFISSLHGVDIVDKNTHESIDLVDIPKWFPYIKIRGNQANEIRSILPVKNKKDHFWFAGFGLFKYDMQSNELQHINFPKSLVEDKGRIPIKNHNEYLFTDMVSYNEYLFFTSWGGGIVEYNTETGEWKKYLREDYILDFNGYDQNVSYSFTNINDSLYFVNFHNFISCFFDVKNRSIVEFDMVVEGDMDQQDKYSETCIFDGHRLWYMNTKSFCSHPLLEEFQYQGRRENIYLREVKVNGLSQNCNLSIYPKFSSTYDKSQRNFHFDFRYVLPDDANKIEYEYKLEGHSKHWEKLGTEHTINYNDLKGADYILKIRAKNLSLANPAWVYMDKPFHFSIEKYLYEYWWFYLGPSFLLVGIFLLINFFVNKSRKDQQRMEMQHYDELQKVKLSALRSQMNPHFLFNSLSSINNYIMHEDQRLASKYLTKFSHLMRQILNNSQEMLIPLADELKTLSLYTEMEKIRFSTPFVYQVNIEEDLDINEVLIPSMIIQPYIENAIIHGVGFNKKDGIISLNISKITDEEIGVLIEDNGIGRKKAMEIKRNKAVKNKSLGMKITRDRLELIKNIYNINTSLSISDLTTKEGEVIGTSVYLTLPYITSINRIDYEQFKN